MERKIEGQRILSKIWLVEVFRSIFSGNEDVLTLGDQINLLPNFEIKPYTPPKLTSLCPHVCNEYNVKLLWYLQNIITAGTVPDARSM